MRISPGLQHEIRGILMLQYRFAQVKGNELGRQILFVHSLNDRIVPVDFRSVFLDVVDRALIELVDFSLSSCPAAFVGFVCSCKVKAFC